MRPVPVHPRMGKGRRGRKAPPLEHVLLGCPVFAPDWELAGIRALIKPQLAGPIRYRNGQQPWSQACRRHLIDAANAFDAELRRFTGDNAAALPPLEFPTDGDFHLVVRAPAADRDVLLGLAVVLSRQLPGLWLVVHKLFVLNGRFFRRQYGYKLRLVEATNVHLPRPIRAAVQATLRSLKPATA